MTAPANSTAGANPRPVQCARCGKSFRADAQPALCEVAGRGEAVHLRCAPPGARVIGLWRGAHFLDLGAVSRGGHFLPVPAAVSRSPAVLFAKMDDARWFEAHPGRCHRLRLPFPGELDARGNAAASNGGADCTRMAVRQLAPNVLVYAQVPALPLEGDEEAIAHLCFDLRRIYSPGATVSLAELQQMLAVYSAWGGRQ
jgi:hypothetical protein